MAKHLVAGSHAEDETEEFIGQSYEGGSVNKYMNGRTLFYVLVFCLRNALRIMSPVQREVALLYVSPQ